MKKSPKGKKVARKSQKSKEVRSPRAKKATARGGRRKSTMKAPPTQHSTAEPAALRDGKGVQNLQTEMTALLQAEPEEARPGIPDGIFVVNDYTKIPETSILLLDIDGTLTGSDGKITDQVAWQLTRLADEKGIYINFITGRDVRWLVKYAIRPLWKFARYPDIRSRFRFYAESGCVRIAFGEADECMIKKPPVLDDHPLCEPETRAKLAKLSYNPGNLIRADQLGRARRINEEEIYDANGVAFIIPARERERPTLWEHVWSNTKQVIGTYEKHREQSGKVKDINQEVYVSEVKKNLDLMGLAKHMHVEVPDTAINLVPKVNGKAMGKSWAAGLALQEIREYHLRGDAGGVEWSQIIRRTLAFGDGEADLDFTSPDLPDGKAKDALDDHMPKMVFVGPPSAIPKEGKPQYPLRRNIIIQATGNMPVIGVPDRAGGLPTIKWGSASGAVVFSEVIDFLWDCFRAFPV